MQTCAFYYRLTDIDMLIPDIYNYYTIPKGKPYILRDNPGTEVGVRKRGQERNPYMGIRSHEVIKSCTVLIFLKGPPPPTLTELGFNPLSR